MITASDDRVLTGSIIRLDPGTMGRTLFFFRASPRDDQYSLECICLGDVLIVDALPALPDLCALIRAARVDMEAGRVPDLEALAPLHLGMTLSLPPVEIRPGDRTICLDFSESEWE